MKKLAVIGILAALTSCSESNEEVREQLPYVGTDELISYTRHEYRHAPKEAEGSLIVLVYDIPYFSGCGVFPPLHVLNQRLASGGGDGGMSPGASWKPFQVDSKTYNALIAKNREIDLSTLKDRARYTRLKYIEDSSFDEVQDQFDWAEAACGKYRDWFILESAK